jgi:hypothetical protein
VWSNTGGAVRNFGDHERGVADCSLVWSGRVREVGFRVVIQFLFLPLYSKSRLKGPEQ